jgi:hypothetical protein
MMDDLENIDIEDELDVDGSGSFEVDEDMDGDFALSPQHETVI